MKKKGKKAGSKTKKNQIECPHYRNQIKMQHHQYPSLQYQTPPQLPKKTRPKQQQNFRPINSANVVHSGAPSIIDIQHLRHPKRKSAVELLAESKPYYVKSEISPTQITGHWVRRWDNGMIGSGGDALNATHNDLAIFDRKQQVLHQSGRAYSSKKSHSSTLSPTSCTFFTFSCCLFSIFSSLFSFSQNRFPFRLVILMILDDNNNK